MWFTDARIMQPYLVPCGLGRALIVCHPFFQFFWHSFLMVVDRRTISSALVCAAAADFTFSFLISARHQLTAIICPTLQAIASPPFRFVIYRPVVPLAKARADLVGLSLPIIVVQGGFEGKQKDSPPAEAQPNLR